MSHSFMKLEENFMKLQERYISVDAKINTLKSGGKFSPSSGKSTKRANQFDL